MAAAAVKPADLLAVALQAAQAGAEVVKASLNKPRATTRKEGLDVVTETDVASEKAVVAVLTGAFPDHAILGEEGGVTGPVSSDYLWLCDPIDGTVNFAAGYQSFCVSVGVVRNSTPIAGAVVEFIGGPVWTTRTFTACRNGGAFVDGKPISVSRTKQMGDAVVATEFVNSDDEWPAVSALYKKLAQQARGVRMSGSAAANLCHLALGSIDAYTQINLKPWDVCAGVIILEEAGGRILTCDGIAYSPFERSLLATNDALMNPMRELTQPFIEKLQDIPGRDMSPWCIPDGLQC